MKPWTLCLALAFLAIATTQYQASAGSMPFSGEPIVISGDRLELKGRELKLMGIDAPDLAQRCLIKDRLYDCGAVSRTALMDLTAGAEVRCQSLHRADETAHFAICTAAGYDLSEGMVYTGWAMADPESGDAYTEVQNDAEAKGRGLWRGRFVKPWDWRAGKRLSAELKSAEGY